MFDFQISLSTLTVGISARYEKTMRSCEGYFCNEQEELFHVCASEEDLRKEAEYFASRNGKDASPLPEWQLERSALYRQIAEEMIDHGRILIHGSALSMDGSGYFFIAPSGTGKSSHSALWRKVFGNHVVMVNDDKPLIHICNDKAYVCGTPWDGKHHLSTNISVPLKGICRICRSDENRIERLSKADGMTRLLEQTYRSRKTARVLKTLEMLKMVTDHIPVYALYCNMEDEAALCAYETLSKGEQI